MHPDPSSAPADPGAHYRPGPAGRADVRALLGAACHRVVRMQATGLLLLMDYGIGFLRPTPFIESVNRMVITRRGDSAAVPGGFGSWRWWRKNDVVAAL